MAIQRYEVRGNNYGEFPSSTGKFVLYADHESECRGRERKAYIKGWRDGARAMADSGWDSDSDAWAKCEATPEALRRYPEVK